MAKNKLPDPEDDREQNDADAEESADDFEEPDRDEEPSDFDAEDDASLDSLDEDDALDDTEVTDEDIEKVAMSSKEQSARSLEIRRALEEQRERRRLSEDLDYLDLDMDE